MLKKNLSLARKAYQNRDIAATIVAHQDVQIEAKENHSTTGQYIKSLIYGGLDGIITSFAVVAGVAGASLSPKIVLIMGFANLIGDGLAMAIGDYLSTKAEVEYNQAERKRETWEVYHCPEAEKKELMEIYTSKGISTEDSKHITDIISKNKKAWVDIMMVEELGIIEESESPIKNALVTFFSFILFGFVPLTSFVFSKFIPSMKPNVFMFSCVLTSLTLFALGISKVKVTAKSWIVSGLEILLVGGLAAACAFSIGILISKVVQ